MDKKYELLKQCLWKYVRAQSRMLDKWSEGDDAVKNGLWKELHGLEYEARELLMPFDKEDKRHEAKRAVPRYVVEDIWDEDTIKDFAHEWETRHIETDRLSVNQAFIDFEKRLASKQSVPNEQGNELAFVFNHDKINEQINKVEEMKNDSFDVQHGKMLLSDYVKKHCSPTQEQPVQDKRIEVSHLERHELDDVKSGFISYQFRTTDTIHHVNNSKLIQAIENCINGEQEKLEFSNEQMAFRIKELEEQIDQHERQILVTEEKWYNIGKGVAYQNSPSFSDYKNKQA